MDTGIVLAVISILIGVLYCCAGYRCFKIALAITGFVVGSAIARYATIQIFETTGIIVWIFGFIGGLGVAVLSLLVYFMGVFIFGASFGALVGGIATVSLSDTAAIIIMIVLGVIGGGLALLIQKHIIIVCTAFSGSWSIVTGAWYLARGVSPNDLFFEGPQVVGQQYYLALACLVALTVLGIVVQYRMSGPKGKPEKAKKTPGAAS